MLRRRLLSAFLFIAVAGCGGGGGSSSLPASAPVNPIAPAPPGATQSVRLAIFIPATTGTAAVTRRPQYVSSQTHSAKISVNGAAAVVVNLSTGAAGCVTTSSGRTCSTTVSAPAGVDTFSESLYASTDGSGTALAQGTTTATIVAGTSNSVTLTLGGVPASVTLALATTNPPQNNTAQTIPLTVTVADAGGAAIIGSDPFVSPVKLTDSDTSGVTTLSATALTSPADAAKLTVNYSGAALSSPAIFGATGTGISKVTTATLTPKGTSNTVAFNDYSTFGYDNQRDVYNPNSVSIAPSSMGSLHLAWQASLSNYNTQTQPVLATGIPGHAGVLIVGGGNGHMTGIDATTGAQIWDTPPPKGQLTYTCNTNTLYFGIGGTVAYDPATKSFYVAGNSNPSLNAQTVLTLYRMSAATGAVLGSVDFAPNPVGASELDFSHTSITLAPNGMAYVGTGATCDISSWRGRIAAINTNTMSLVTSFFPAWNPNNNQPYGGGGIWGWGGVALDSNQNIIVGVGNTDNHIGERGTISPPFVQAPEEYSGYGESFMSLTPDLGTINGSNKPIPLSAYFSTADANDLDINGTPVIFKPLTGSCEMAAIQGKAGALVLYNTANISAGPVKTFQLAPPNYEDQFIGSPAYSPATGLLYTAVPVGSGLYPPGMIAVSPNCGGAPSVTWHSQFGPDSDANGNSDPRSVPAVSAGGVVFVGTPCAANGSGGCAGNLPVTTSAAARSTQSLRKPQICCSPPSSSIGGAVWALDASTGEVLNGGLPILTTPGLLRMPPTIDGNWVFVIDNSGDMYGLTIDPSVKAVAGTYRAADARSQYRWGGRASTAVH